VVSNEAPYTVETPSGEDAAVWEWIKRLPSPNFWRDPLGRQIWEQHPGSRYAAFSLRDRDTTDLSLVIASYEAALAKDPDESWAQWLRLGIANAEIQRSRGLLDASDVDGAYAAIHRASTIAAGLAKESGNPSIRNRAQLILDKYSMTRDQVADLVRRMSGQIREVRPFVACVEDADGGKHRFWFGYDNTAPESLSVQIGKDNKFTPPPFDRGQPTVFAPREVVRGLQVLTDEPSLTWHLQKYNVHASVATTPRCPANFYERFKYEPPQRN